MSRGILLLALVIVSGCATASRQSLDGEPSMSSATLAGTSAALQLEQECGGVNDSAEAEQRLEAIGEWLVLSCAELPRACRYRVLNECGMNAFSLPGRIYLTRGLYARLDDDDLLTAALAHEFAHLVRDDSLRPRCADEREALEREMLADAMAVEYLRRCGADPTAMARLIEIVAGEQPEGWATRRIARLPHAGTPDGSR